MKKIYNLHFLYEQFTINCIYLWLEYLKNIINLLKKIKIYVSIEIIHNMRLE